MISYYKFRQDLFAPVPAKDSYNKPGKGSGWPDQCPPVRAGNSFGFDLLANFDITFRQTSKTPNGWIVEPDIVIESDFDYAASEESDGKPLVQQYAWFWEKGQKIPHVITDNVFEVIRNQVKISSFLFMKTDANELLYFTEPPNQRRPFRTVTAVADTDWYPASYPWHIAIELDWGHKTIEIAKGTPLGRIFTVRRDTYFAQPMTTEAFDDFFARGQQWLAANGREPHGAVAKELPPGVLDLTHTYSRQQMKSKFVTME